MEVINDILKVVNAKRDILLAAQKKYNALTEKAITTQAYYDARREVIEAHEQYRAALGLLVTAIIEMKAVKKQMKMGLGSAKEYSGPEFIEGKIKRRPHCEPWTVNGTNADQEQPDDQLCAVVCRNEPSCVGFTKDPDAAWCIWFDDAKPDPKEACTAQLETKYVKKRQAEIDEDLWTAIEKIRVFDKAITEALELAETNEESTHKGFRGLWPTKIANKAVKLALKDSFENNVDKYTGTILDTLAMRKQYVKLQGEAFERSKKTSSY